MLIKIISVWYYDFFCYKLRNIVLVTINGLELDIPCRQLVSAIYMNIRVEVSVNVFENSNKITLYNNIRSSSIYSAPFNLANQNLFRNCRYTFYITTNLRIPNFLVLSTLQVLEDISEVLS